MEDQEIWVLDLDSSPVAVSEDGSVTPVSSEELAQTTTEGPVAEAPAEDPVEGDVSADAGTSAEDPVVSDTEGTEGVQTDVTESTEVVEDFSEAWLESEAFFAMPDPVVRTFTVTTPDVLEVVQYSDVSTVMVDVVESVLGEYQRMTYTVEEYDTDGNLLATSVEYVPGLAGLDYAWITGAVLFGMLIAGCLKLLGGLIRS